jgi:hypothetical protein
MSRRRSRWMELRPASAWEYPCGTQPAKGSGAATPVRTVVSLREPHCPFCGRVYRDEYRIGLDGESR